MAAAVRNKSNPPRKGPGLQDSNPPRRAAAWRGSSNPPPNAYTQAPPNQSPRLAQQFPALGAQNNGAAPDTPLPPPALIGSTIIVSTRSGQRYEGSLMSVPAAADGDAALQLKDVKDLVNPSTPLKETVTLPAGSLAHWSNAGFSSDSISKPNGDFRTDTDISGITARRERELQAWQPDGSVSAVPSGNVGIRGDEATFGPGSNAPNGWDQFAVNESLFGVKTSFDEDLYTTKIDRSTPDFKERERKAQALANEIMGTATTNPHLAEERGLTMDDSGVNEEDKYAGVVRGANAYVPPARRAGSGSNVPQVTKPATTLGATQLPTEIPKVSVTDSSSSSKPTSPPAGTSSPSEKAPDVATTFRDFVTNEKQRLTQKRQAIVKNEMDKRMSELVKFSQSFKLNRPIPEDLVVILAKDEEKQKQIREKASRDAASAAARSIGMSHSTSTPIPRPAPASPPTQAKPKPPAPTASAKPSPAGPVPKKDGQPARIPMVIQKIPPFNPNKAKGTNASPGSTATQDKDKEMKEDKEKSASPPPSDPAVKLNVNASPFKLKPNAPTFKPVAPSPSPKSKPAEPVSQNPAPPATPNPFFGTRVLKKGAPVHVKDDFNPFKNAKVAEASTITSMWPYNGKRYITMFPNLPPPPAPQPMPQHIPPTGPPAPPPPPYEEDQHAAAARGYGMVYAYSPYAYPGQPPQQPMMAGAPPSGPPGNYIPSPFLQPMHYPPMPPNGHQAMYAPPPSMGNMPPPQQYMQPPPPGAYPPPPNGAGRGSMPPTPMPPHAHAYAYHQSPQLSHAVPYQMMMPPPPNGPPHGNYENGPPPVPMGGVGHA